MCTKQNALVLIQARLGSTRLPAKSILPIAGIPLVILVAQRAANTCRVVRVLTSNDPSDDCIVDELVKFNIDYFRGDLTNVLKRYCDALDGVPHDTKVFRLTADNPIVDGTFLDEMELACNNADADIFYADANEIGMPVGLSAELTTAGWLRRALQDTTNAYDIEHVTPYIYRHGTSVKFASKFIPKRRNLRVGIDTFDDYMSVKSLFHGQSDPANAQIKNLLNNTNLMKYRPYYDPATKPMTLGGVQFGLDYGVTNSNGMLSENESIAIIKQAITEGIQYIDTASVYGKSERVIGKSLTGGWSNRVKVITKLNLFDETKWSENRGVSLSLMVRNSFLQSCVNLRADHIDTLMLHHANHLNYPEIINELKKLKKDGLIKHIGVSVQNPHELDFVLKNKDVSIIQLPYNILDYRWEDIVDVIKCEREKRSLIIHARSALLQGLLCSDNVSHWLIAGIENSDEIVSWLEEKFKQHEKMSVSDLCIGFVNSHDWIDSVVIGIDNEKNLFSNLQSISMPLMSKDSLDELYASRPFVNSVSLNPANWRTNV